MNRSADSVFDMAVHNPARRDDLSQLDWTKLYNSIKEELTLLRNPDPNTWGPAHCHFGHLMSGYDAGYYSYLRFVFFSSPY